MSDEVVAAVEEIVGREADADDVLRAVVATLVERGGMTSACILFHEDGELVPGPRAGSSSTEATHTPVVYAGAEVAQLVTEGPADQLVLTRVAELIAEHCLVGWDTRGEPWDAGS